jgi:hypothetical protein
VTIGFVAVDLVSPLSRNLWDKLVWAGWGFFMQIEVFHQYQFLHGSQFVEPFVQVFGDTSLIFDDDSLSQISGGKKRAF